METLESYLTTFESKPLKFYDKSYNLVPQELVYEEYCKIKYWLSKNHRPGDRIALWLDNTYHYTLLEIASMNLGITFIPMRNVWPSARVEQIKKITNFKTLMDQKSLEEVLKSPKRLLVPSQKLSEEDPLYIMFTSGSTGEPKGVEILRKSYQNFLNWIDLSFDQIGPDDKLLNSTHFTFDVSLMEVGLLLTKNIHFYTSNMGNNPLIMADELSKLSITISVTIPNAYNLILSERIFSELHLENLKHILLAGSRFPTPLWEKIKRLLPKATIYNCYGPTEATIYCLYKMMTGNKENDISKEVVSIGDPLPNTLAVLIDEKGKEITEPYKKGELLIGGTQLMSRYINSKELTKSALINIKGENYYKTGDLGFQNESKEFFVVGRNDDTVKVSGQRVNLSDIDSYILKLGPVKECASIAISHESKGTELICYLVLNDSEALTPIKLKKQMKSFLLPFQIPQKIILTETLPLNNSGKIDKRKLVENYQASL